MKFATSILVTVGIACLSLSSAERVQKNFLHQRLGGSSAANELAKLRFKAEHAKAVLRKADDLTLDDSSDADVVADATADEAAGDADASTDAPVDTTETTDAPTIEDAAADILDDLTASATSDAADDEDGDDDEWLPSSEFEYMNPTGIFIPFDKKVPKADGVTYFTSTGKQECGVCKKNIANAGDLGAGFYDLCSGVAPEYQKMCHAQQKVLQGCPEFNNSWCYQDLGGTQKLLAPCPDYLVCHYCLGINPLYCV